LSSSLKQVAYQHLRKRMLSGQLPPGQRISPDASARELGMSQTPVREAIGLLESEGLVEQLPNLGAFVRVPTRREIADLSDLRVVLEGFAVARAAKRIKPAQLRELESTFARMRDLAGRIRDGGEPAFRGKLSDEIALVDVEFHMILLRAAGNERVLKIIDDLHVLSRLMSFGREFTVTDVTREMATLIKLHG
jgi:DNA-binding GntR family transcriptional regulator